MTCPVPGCGAEMVAQPAARALSTGPAPTVVHVCNKCETRVWEPLRGFGRGTEHPEARQ